MLAAGGMVDLSKNETLASACRQAVKTIENGGTREGWRRRLTEFLNWVGQASPKQRRTLEFQQRIWNDTPVAATGQGNINVDKALADPKFRNFIAGLWEQELPLAPDARVAALKRLLADCMRRIEPHVGNRTPRLKVLRVFTAAFPHDFTTIAHAQRLYALYHAIYGSGSPEIVECNRLVRAAIDATAGPAGKDLASTVERLMLPWALYEDYVQENGANATEEVVAPGELRLRPLPAARRRRGLLAIGGYVETLAGIIEFARGGCEREDLREHIRSLNPKLKDSSINTTINALMAEWGAIRAQGSHLELTERAEAFLDSGDPGEFSGWLLTQVLGVDNLLWELRQKGALTRADTIDTLRLVNPGWTSDFAPTVMIRWLEQLHLITREAPSSPYRLTEDGRQWAEQISWVPQRLEPALAVADVEKAPTAAAAETCRVPEFGQIAALVNEHGVFSNQLVAQLHHGLWSRGRRHFSVLAGLSGAGKTLLARGYGLALAQGLAQPESHLLTVPVQPGWYDPSPLLGFVNPLNSESYQRTAFLDFLLGAVQDPERPYSVVLDEMNLSHPEQYLAPLLSAMETGGKISLHSQGQELEGVPPFIEYPANLVLIGTVNMDETTHALSDKVLDRAFVMEFWDVDVGGCPAWSASALPAEFKLETRKLLEDLMQALRPVRLHFGWRLIDDVLGFLDSCHRGGGLELNEALDAAIYAKVLPKLRGEETPRLVKAFNATHAALVDRGLPSSAAKVEELLEDLRHTGSARFWR